MRKVVPFLVVLGVVMGVLYLALPKPRASQGPGEAVPEIFAANLTYEEALDRASGNGRKVLLFATADWCGPCQILKQGPLSDERVQRVVEAHVEPVYLDVTDPDSNPEAAEVARSFGIRALPTMVLVRDGREVSRMSGYRRAEDIIAWLKRD